MSKPLCRICNNSNGLEFYSVKEMMLGTRDEFIYYQCPRCQCLQIQEIPENLGQYYPRNYYSYHTGTKNFQYRIRSWIDRRRVIDALHNGSLLGKIINKTSKPLEYIPWITSTRIGFDSRILDVGCGQGRLLLRLSMGGFRNLSGVDPFVNNDIRYYESITISKQSLNEFSKHNGGYDYIMLHHSLEHMPDQHEAFNSLFDLLAPDGVILIRIPLADSYAWEHYREHWVQLDPPRHLFLHSRNSLTMMAENHGFNVGKIVYDSAKFQFTGSELYLRDIPLSSDKGSRDIFTKQQLTEFEKKAEELNASSKGDQAAFYLTKAAQHR